MTKNILLSGEALKAGMRIKAMADNFGEATEAIREKFNKEMEVLVAANMESTKAQWGILATALGLDPVADFGKWSLVTEYAEYGHMYIENMEADVPPQVHPLAGDPKQPN